jgi:hypothetical protein
MPAIAALLGATVLGALSAPTAALQGPRLAIVNGIPGRTVDVCVDNTEVRSNLRYGKWVQRVLSPGNASLRFRAASPGNCKGTVLGKESLVLAADADLTIVGTRLPDKVVAFDNNPLPLFTLAHARFRYAGDLGDVNLVAQITSFSAPAAAPPVFHKGDQSTPLTSGNPFAMRYAVFKAGTPQAFRDTGWIAVESGQRLEVVIVGSTTGNDRVVIIRRSIPMT